MEENKQPEVTKKNDGGLYSKVEIPVWLLNTFIIIGCLVILAIFIYSSLVQ